MRVGLSASAAEGAKLLPNDDGDGGGDGDGAILHDALAAEKAILSTPLMQDQWLALGSALSELLIANGLRPVAVHACVRHDLDAALSPAIGQVSAQEREQARSLSEVEVVTGSPYAALIVPPPVA